MISGNTLVDEENAFDGTITWGSNSDDLSITVGGITSYEDTVAASDGDVGISDTVQSATQPASWFSSGTGAGLPFYDTFAAKAIELGMPSQSLYLMMMLGVAVAAGLSVFLFTGSLLIGTAASGIFILAGISTGILSAWMIAIFIAITLSVMYLARQH